MHQQEPSEVFSTQIWITKIFVLEFFSLHTLLRSAHSQVKPVSSSHWSCYIAYLYTFVGFL